MIEDPMAFGLQLTVLGLVVVFFALTLITLVVANLWRVDHWLASRAAKREAAMAEVVPEPTSSDELSPELLAVISAAVSVALDQRVRVKTVRYRRVTRGAGWSVQGRSSVMGATSLRRY